MAYRKIDVDAFDGETFLDDEELLFNAPPAQKAHGSQDALSSTPTLSRTETAPLYTNVPTLQKRPAHEWEQEVQQLTERSRACLNRGDALGALVNALQGPVPLGTLAPPTVKSSQLSIVMETLLAHRVADIPKTLASPRLTVDHLDLLMQYVYKGMSMPEQYSSGGTLLAWHEKLVEKQGVGSIVRVMTNRLTV